MLYDQIIVNCILFLIGAFGILLNRGNILLVLMCIEIMLLSANLNFATVSVYLDDSMGLIFFILSLTIAAAESAIGLAILITYFRARGNISITAPSILRG